MLSSTALHWLDPAVLVSTYRRAFRLLRPEGVLLNADYLPHPPGSRLRAARDAVAGRRAGLDGGLAPVPRGRPPRRRVHRGGRGLAGPPGTHPRRTPLAADRDSPGPPGTGERPGAPGCRREAGGRGVPARCAGARRRRWEDQPQEPRAARPGIGEHPPRRGSPFGGGSRQSLNAC
ncbi:hypothetical protein [Saccharothrix coeruleofusca]|uniref:hypothetical protein n=1 Tax=Saccharothrix coeruleofusca TaxID=33919 RepID=UPI003570AD42